MMRRRFGPDDGQHAEGDGPEFQPGLGVKIRYFYYWSDEMRDPELEKTEVPVCYDPDDLGVAFARLRNRWVQWWEATRMPCEERPRSS
jgi:hypothetical protein